jgi:hypothetical protein
MGKSKGSTTATTAPDAQTAQYGQQVWDAAQRAGAAPGYGVDPQTTAAGQGFAGFANAGNLGLGALSGDPSAVKSFMSPYQQNVIDQLHKQFGLMRSDATNDVNAQATAAGAFGGSRHGVAEGVALGKLGDAEGQQTATALNQGFGDAMSRAGSVANLGFGANGALAGLGEYNRNVAMQNDPAMRQFSLLSQAFAGMPRGTVTNGTQTNGHNGATGALGGAATGAQIGSMFGPGIGTGIGAGIGGLLGLFG